MPLEIPTPLVLIEFPLVGMAVPPATFQNLTVIVPASMARAYELMVQENGISARYAVVVEATVRAELFPASPIVKGMPWLLWSVGDADVPPSPPASCTMPACPVVARGTSTLKLSTLAAEEVCHTRFWLFAPAAGVVALKFLIGLVIAEPFT